MIGDYRVSGFLGEGGMGEVYSAVHEKLGRAAAVKVLGTGAQDESFKTRFFNEARLQAGLHHPNIATLYDFREENGQFFIFMELVDGESLDDLVARRAFTIDETLNIFASICEAISYIHKNGVVHRDIKAQNVKLTASGAAKLLDFGIAKDGASHGLTQTGGVIGTPNYLPPEQLEGKPATPQADIWALGVLLYEMLTGQPPFAGDTLGGLVLKITRAEFIAPEKINPAVPRGVTAIVAKCLKKDLGARYRSADELLDAVRKVSGTRQTQATLVSREMHFAHGSDPGAFPETIATDDAFDQPRASSPKPFPIGLAAGLGIGGLFLLIAIAGGAFLLKGANEGARVTAAANATTGVSRGSMKVKVDVDEGKAQVTRAGEVLGTTPLDIDANPGDELNLTLTREGYQDKNVNIQVSNGKKVFTFSMKAK